MLSLGYPLVDAFALKDLLQHLDLAVYSFDFLALVFVKQGPLDRSLKLLGLCDTPLCRQTSLAFVATIFHGLDAEVGIDDVRVHVFELLDGRHAPNSIMVRFTAGFHVADVAVCLGLPVKC